MPSLTLETTKKRGTRFQVPRFFFYRRLATVNEDDGLRGGLHPLILAIADPVNLRGPLAYTSHRRLTQRDIVGVLHHHGVPLLL